MSAPQPHPTPVVYIVDDDCGVRDSLQILLRLHGYAAMSFSTGEALLASLDESRARAGGVVLLDLRLPGMSGVSLAERGGKVIRLSRPGFVLRAKGLYSAWSPCRQAAPSL